MSIFLALAAAAATPTPAVVTIIVDTSDVCYSGRIADAKRERAQRQARKLERELKAQGKAVRIVHKRGWIPMTTPDQILVQRPGC